MLNECIQSLAGGQRQPPPQQKPEAVRPDWHNWSPSDWLLVGLAVVVLVAALLIGHLRSDKTSDLYRISPDPGGAMDWPILREDD
jgi:hypothetical protein